MVKTLIRGDTVFWTVEPFRSPMGDFFSPADGASELTVFFRCSSPRACPCKRSDNNFTPLRGIFLANQNFRRGTDDVKVIEMVVIKIRRRIEGS